jgi:hypothetical protein
MLFPSLVLYFVYRTSVNICPGGFLFEDLKLYLRSHKYSVYTSTTIMLDKSVYQLRYTGKYPEVPSYTEIASFALKC